MDNLRQSTVLRLVKVFNAILVTVPFGLCWYLVYADRIAEPYYKRGNWAVIGLFLVIYIGYARLYEALQIGLNRIGELVGSQFLALLMVNGIMYVIIWLLTKRLPDALPMIITLLIQLCISTIWTVCAHRWYFTIYRAKRTAIIYDKREGLDRLISEYGLEHTFNVLKVVTIEQVLKNPATVLDQIDTIFLCGVSSHERNILLKQCVSQAVEIYAIPCIGDVIMSGAKRMHMFHLPMLRVTRYCPNPEYLMLKRTLDIIVSGLGLAVFFPVMLLIAVMIKATDGGTVFYKQQRLTKDGRRFDMLKFRSMRMDAEQDGVARLSTGENDSRITPVGRVIRKCRLDELPQLINIFTGDMTLVGPRPERPEIAAQYEQELPEFALRLQAKAGLTGYAQVYGKYNTTPYDKLQMDLMYISNPSMIEDLKIMFATIKILFIADSTEGVAEGQKIASK